MPHLAFIHEHGGSRMARDPSWYLPMQPSFDVASRNIGRPEDEAIPEIVGQIRQARFQGRLLYTSCDVTVA